MALHYLVLSLKQPMYCFPGVFTIPNPGGGFAETLTGYPLNVDELSLTNVNTT